MPELRGFYVYVLKCIGTAQYYIGETYNFRRRLEAHVRGFGGARFTALFPPEEIIAVWQVPNSTAALEMERILQRAQELGCIGELLNKAPDCEYIDMLEFLRLLPSVANWRQYDWS